MQVRRELRERSRELRKRAVEMLRGGRGKENEKGIGGVGINGQAGSHQAGSHQSESHQSESHQADNADSPVVFLQGTDSLTIHELVSAAAAQYNITNSEYCSQMEDESTWGGGPEIVALCNVLQRPIHVFELGVKDVKDVVEEGIRQSSGGRGARDSQGRSVGVIRGVWDNFFARLNWGARTPPAPTTTPPAPTTTPPAPTTTPPTTTTKSSTTKSSTTKSSTTKSSTTKSSRLLLRRPTEKRKFVLRRMACFGSPLFDKREPLCVLSADSRFPDVRPGKQMESGNHFMALFPRAWGEGEIVGGTEQGHVIANARDKLGGVGDEGKFEGKDEDEDEDDDDNEGEEGGTEGFFPRGRRGRGAKRAVRGSWGQRGGQRGGQRRTLLQRIRKRRGV